MYWLRVFGGLGIEREGAVVDDVVSHRKALALLAVLATNGPTSRDSLLALLWPESDTRRARGSLKQAVHFLRRRLNSADLFLGIDELRLNPAVVESDVCKFAEALAAGDLRNAAALYSGRFLAGFHAGNAAEFDRWAATRADEFAQQYANVLEKLARAAETESDLAEAASWWRHLLTLDPTNSRFTLHLMQALEASGQRAAALQHARAHELLLREEWGLEPDPAVTALADELRSAPPPVAMQGTEMPRDELVRTDTLVAVESEPAPQRTRLHVRAVAGIIILLGSGVLVTAVLSGWLQRRSSTDVSQAPRRIAVLPFDEPSNSKESHYLAVGLSDAISTELSRLRPLIVSGYLSTEHYRGTSKPLSRIANELSASAVVKASVQRAGERVRVDAQLFDAKTNKPLWAQRYDRPMTEVLDIQRNAVQGIVGALRLDLTKAERALLVRPPTTDSRAYDLYLRGREVELRGSGRSLFSMPAENMRDAQSLYSRARELDPTFAIVRARLAIMHLNSALKYDATPARREHARLEAEAALRLHPGLPEAHEALAFYWSVAGNDEAKSIEHMKLVLAGFPNDSDVHLSLAWEYAKQGHWEESVAALKRATQIDPHSANPAFEAALIYNRLRRYQESIKAWDQVIALEPDNPSHKIARGYVFLMWHGTADTLAAALRRIPATWDPDGAATFARYMVARIGRRHSDALAILDASRHQVTFNSLFYRPLTLVRAQTYEALGERALALSNYQAALALLADSIAAAHPGHIAYAPSTPEVRMRIALGLGYAGLGRKQDAIREARRAMELVPLSSNHAAATATMAGAVEIFVQAGELKSALELLELLLAMPAGREVSVPLLRVDPTYDPLRSDPRFEQLLKRFSTN